MMTHEELAALLAEETHTFKCGGCGANWITPKSGAALLFHMCQATRTRMQSRRAVGLPDPECPSLEERWHALFSGSAGGYQRPTPEEAREETSARRNGAFTSGVPKAKKPGR